MKIQKNFNLKSAPLVECPLPIIQRKRNDGRSVIRGEFYHRPGGKAHDLSKLEFEMTMEEAFDLAMVLINCYRDHRMMQRRIAEDIIKKGAPI